ncbi:hypothetical protein [Pseudochrobactrum sp. HB0163]|uniref:hypothetical protein n=1 Tax=Pseudochrobactrum sp. HB0163 TaxID=3450708 RepID=UPI003F6DAED5
MNKKLIVIIVAAIVAVLVLVINVSDSGGADSQPTLGADSMPATKGFTHTAPKNSDARYKEF